MNYTVYHLHSDRSLLDSCTNYKLYIERAKELGQNAICFTEHGNVYSWIEKKMACEKAGLKYLHGVECYLTRDISGEEKVRDNYHTVLIARNYKGVQEINALMELASRPDHFYYKPRITFDEFLATSENIISTSACLASPLAKLEPDDEYFLKLAQKYTYYEVQPHDHPDQKEFNQRLLGLAKVYGKPIIAGTDTHNLNSYKAECRSVLLAAKKIMYSDEDSFDLTYRSYEEVCEAFRRQGVLSEDEILTAMENTNVMADSVEEFELDTSFKYPMIYGSYEEDAKKYHEVLWKKFQDKVDDFIIPPHQEEDFKAALQEETRVFDKINMTGFMLFMSELVCWCKANGIPVGFNRGSCGGSRVAYVLDITDLNPEEWHTVFSRFANEDRKEIGDIDIDVAPDDRDRVYEYIINKFGAKNTAYILALGTVNDKGCIDEIARALSFRHEGEKNNPYSIENTKKIKALYESDKDAAREKYPELFYYFDGIVNTVVSQSMHPAGIVVSPVTLPDNYGTFWKDGKQILQIDMEEIHEVSLVKYDILALKNIQIIRDCCKMASIPYPKSHEVDWYDKKVWADMLRSPVGIFQMEGDYAFSCLKTMRPRNIFDMSLVTAALRPSGASYRDRLLQRKQNHNPSRIIDEMLAPNLGYLIYQEDTIKFLQEICGLSGSEADNLRRAIGRKDKDRLNASLPRILEGYCEKSPRPREEAELEAKTFLQIIEDSADYQFGYNHSIGYCMVGYMCAYLRYYYPYEFITAFLNDASNSDDITNGCEVARLYGIRVRPPLYSMSHSKYFFNKDEHSIYMGCGSVKFVGDTVADNLYEVSKQDPKENFLSTLVLLSQEKAMDTRQRDILIRIGYFRDFGGGERLARVAEVFDDFKGGDAKFVAKNPDGKYYEALSNSQYVNNDPKKKRFEIVSCMELIAEICQKIPNTEFPQTDLIAWQVEYLGDLQPTGEDKDKYVLYVREAKTARRKSDGKKFGININYTSLGTGKSGYATVFSRYVHEEIKKGMLLRTRPNDWQRSRGFFNLNGYEVIGTVKEAS